MAKKTATRAPSQQVQDDEAVQIRIRIPKTLMVRILKMKRSEGILHEHDIIRFATSEAVKRAGY